MGNTHMKQKVVISALAGMILIPGSAVPVILISIWYQQKRESI